MFEKTSRLLQHPAEMYRAHDTGIPEPWRRRKERKTRNQFSGFETTEHRLSFPQSPIDPKTEIQDGRFQSNLKVDKSQSLIQSIAEPTVCVALKPIRRRLLEGQWSHTVSEGIIIVSAGQEARSDFVVDLMDKFSYFRTP